MKKLCLLAIATLLFTGTHATTITAILNNGVWKTNTTWDKNRKPQNGDTILIPVGKTIVINDQQALNNVYIKVLGTLKFNNALSYLSLTGTSGMIVQPGGMIQATIDLWQYIFLGGNTIFYAGQLLGPQQTSGGGFTAFNPLPVKFIGFTVSRKTFGAVLVQWSTSEEINANTYEVERRQDGNNWNRVATVAAVNATTAINNYSVTDEQLTTTSTHYRVKQIDNDGRFTYTAIRTIKAGKDPGAGITIAAVENKLLLQFPQQLNGQLLVRTFTTSGQLLESHTITDPLGQIILPSKAKGLHLISITDGNEVQVTKMVMM